MSTEIIEHPTAETRSAIFSLDGMEKLMRFAEIMAKGRATLPNHLQGNVADCLSVALQAAQWGMHPFAVAQKTHLINGTLGYEAQLINAAIMSMAPTKDRINYEWFGPWEGVIGKFTERTSDKGKKYLAPNWTVKDEEGCGVTVWATMKGEDVPRKLDLLLTQAQVRNSTLWGSDPKQQLAYLAVKRWARLHCPDVILGVYSPDELEERPERDVTPPPQAQTVDDLNLAIGKSVAMSTEWIEKETRSPQEILTSFTAAAERSKTLKELASCYDYALNNLGDDDLLLSSASTVYENRKAELTS